MKAVAEIDGASDEVGRGAFEAEGEVFDVVGGVDASDAVGKKLDEVGEVSTDESDGCCGAVGRSPNVSTDAGVSSSSLDEPPSSSSGQLCSQFQVSWCAQLTNDARLDAPRRSAT